MVILLHYIYHSYGDTSGHLTNRYIPLLYLNPGGFFMCSERAFPGYRAAWILFFIFKKNISVEVRFFAIFENQITFNRMI